jgi:hypothetical protein
MKISDATLALESSHGASRKDEVSESLEIWRDKTPQGERGGLTGAIAQLQKQVMALLQHSPTSLAASIGDQMGSAPVEKVSNGEEPLSDQEQLEFSLMKLLVERFSGRKIRVIKPGDLKQRGAEPVKKEAGPHPDAASDREGWGMVYRYSHTYVETERMEFHAQGTVKTADGQEIAIEVTLTMSRAFYSEESFELRAGDALKDPLVVNFSGNGAELTRQTFNFDIDADGSDDQIRFVTPQSGFLTLDRNRDGRVNDGSELFGALSGDGFAELAEHDSDANGWIDENDPVFSRLRIWTKDSDGADRLLALGSTGIGAIYLGHITTPFELKDGANQLQGAVRESGLYLKEEGGAGTLQQIDLVV